VVREGGFFKKLLANQIKCWRSREVAQWGETVAVQVLDVGITLLCSGLPPISTWIFACHVCDLLPTLLRQQLAKILQMLYTALLNWRKGFV